MLDIDTVLGWRGKTVVDRDGEKIGTFEDVYLDRETDRPAYAGVKSGLFGTKASFCRLEDAEIVGDDVRVPFEKAHVLDAPRIDPDVALTAHEEALLDEHYDTEEPGAGAVAVDQRDPRRRHERRGARHRRPGGRHAGRDGPSEEEVRLRNESRPRERVRLKKVMVTDHVERTVPVRREEVRLEHEPPPKGRVVDVEDASRPSIIGVIRFAPPLLLMGLIFFLSAQPDLNSGLGTWDTVLRKLAHMAEFGLLWLLWWRALGLRATS